MPRTPKPSYVVLVRGPNDVIPEVEGPYSEEVAERQFERIYSALERKGMIGTGTPGMDFSVWLVPNRRGPIRVREYIVPVTEPEAAGWEEIR